MIEQIGMFGYKVEWVEMVIDLAEEVGWLAGWLEGPENLGLAYR